MGSGLRLGGETKEEATDGRVLHPFLRGVLAVIGWAGVGMSQWGGRRVVIGRWWRGVGRFGEIVVRVFVGVFGTRCPNGASQNVDVGARVDEGRVGGIGCVGVARGPKEGALRVAFGLAVAAAA